MKRGVIFFFCLLMGLAPNGATCGATSGVAGGSATSGMGEAHEEGKAFSADKQKEGLQHILEGQGVVPTFDGDSVTSDPSHRGLYESADLSAATAAVKSEARSFIEESKASRQHFTFDTQTDPLFVRSESVVEEQVATSDGAYAESESETPVPATPVSTSSIHECVEGLETHEASCTSTLIVDAHLQKGKTKVWGCVEFGRRFHSVICKQWKLLELGEEGQCVSVNERNVCKKFTSSFLKTLPPGIEHGIKARTVVWISWDWMETYLNDREMIGSEFTIQAPSPPQVDPDQVIVDSERWIDSCPHLEQLSDAGTCAYVSKICTQGPETRTINGASVHRECWQYTSKYMCEHPKKDGCKALRERGCFQVGSSCHEQTAQGCESYKQTYRCEEVIPSLKGQRRQNNLGLFCADGSCADIKYAANQDMLESISKLQILKEMGKDMAGEPLSLFKGSDQRCSKSTLSFSDCCGLSGGWSESIKMTQCSGEEKDLGTRRQKGLCQLVGTYCAEKEKVTGVCLKKKTSYCCFSSKLARLFQTQGRAQLGVGWGSATSPNCRGLTVEELIKIDFTKLDTKEIFSEIAGRYRPENQTKDLREKTLQSIENNMKQMKEGLNGKGL